MQPPGSMDGSATTRASRAFSASPAPASTCWWSAGCTRTRRWRADSTMALTASCATLATISGRVASSWRTTWRASCTAVRVTASAICSSRPFHWSSRLASSAPNWAAIWRAKFSLKASSATWPSRYPSWYPLSRACCTSASHSASVGGGGGGGGAACTLFSGRSAGCGDGGPPAPPNEPGRQLAKPSSSSRGMKRDCGAPRGGTGIGFSKSSAARAWKVEALEEVIGASRSQHDLAFVDQAADDLQHFLLLGLDFRHAHRAARIEVFAQRLGGTAGHVAEHLLAQLRRGALERDDQRLALHFLEQRLEALVVELVQVVEREHVVHDLLGQLVVRLADVVECRGLDRRAHQVDDFRSRLDAAQRRLLQLLAAGEHLAHHFVEVLEGGRLDAVQRGDADQHLVALAFGERLQHARGLVEVEVHQDRRDDLRVFVAQQLGHRAGVHPLERLDAGDVAALQDAVDQQAGLVLAERLAQHGLDVFVGVLHQHVLGLRDGAEAVEHAVHALARDRLHAGDGLAQLLHFLGRKVLEDGGGLFLAEGHQQDRCVLDALVVVLGCGHG